jgi:hypothetical protein
MVFLFNHRDTNSTEDLKSLLLLPLCGGAAGSLVLICRRLPANQKNKTLCELCASSEVPQGRDKRVVKFEKRDKEVQYGM